MLHGALQLLQWNINHTQLIRRHPYLSLTGEIWWGVCCEYSELNCVTMGLCEMMWCNSHTHTHTYIYIYQVLTAKAWLLWATETCMEATRFSVSGYQNVSLKIPNFLNFFINLSAWCMIGETYIQTCLPADMTWGKNDYNLGEDFEM